jgi:hypothetical protein
MRAKKRMFAMVAASGRFVTDAPHARGRAERLD